MSDGPGIGTSPAVVETPGLGTTVTIYLCAAIGGFVAAIADVVQKEEASAVVKLTSVSARHMEIVLQPKWTLLGLVLLAAALCFVFQPRDRKASFSVGVGIIAVIMTVTPYQQPLTGLPTNMRQQNGGLPYDGSVQLAAVTSDGRLWRADETSERQRTGIVFEVTNRSDMTAIVGISVFDRNNNQEYRQKAAVDSDSTVNFPFEIPQHEIERTVDYRLEINGFPTNTAKLNVQPLTIILKIDITKQLTQIAEVENSGIRRLGRILAKPFGW